MSQVHEFSTTEKATKPGMGGFDARLLGYLAAAGAIAAATQSASAVVVSRQLNHTVYGQPDEAPDFFDLDVDLNGTIDFQFIHGDADSDPGEVSNIAVVGAGAGNSTLAAPLLPGQESIKAPRLTSSTYLPTTAFASKNAAVVGFDVSKVPAASLPPSLYNPWPGNSGFLGLQFLDLNGDTHFGFVQMSVDAENSATPLAMHLEWVSYETEANKPIHVQSPVPEPASLGALALGAIGLGAFRRRRVA